MQTYELITNEEDNMVDSLLNSNNTKIMPIDFNPEIYKQLYADLVDMNDDQLLRHYLAFGINEGRRCNAIKNRSDFTGLISKEMKVLEIGPFTNPVVTGENVQYADYLSTDELRERATAHKRNLDFIPNVEFVLSNIELGNIDCSFDAVISSHCIEHQLDLLQHLIDVEKLISVRGGKYFVLIPDKRYCFDRNFPITTIADILDAYLVKRKAHLLKDVISHLALTVHNDSIKHWDGKNKIDHDLNLAKVKSAIKLWNQNNGSYIDVHAWFFTPNSFFDLVNILYSMDLINLSLESIYPTMKNKNEFWAILKLAR